MITVCPHCRAANDAPVELAEVTCQKCGQPFEAVSIEEAAARRRALWKIVALVTLILLLLALLLFAPDDSRTARAAREAVFGKPIAGLLDHAGDGEGDGEFRSGGGNNTRLQGDNLPDPQATGEQNPPDASIGRAPTALRHRPPGDEVRAGAAGADEPSVRVGNSPEGPATAAAGANPANSIRNSAEAPSGADLETGFSTGDDPGALAQTNTSTASTFLLDDFSERLRQAGARSGDVQISLEWKNINDLDLHVIDPSGEEIFYNHRISASGGRLDVDMNAAELTWRPVENVYWPERGAARGTYRVEVVHFANHGAPDPTPFAVRVINKGQAAYFRGAISHQPNRVRSRVLVCTFAVP